MEHRLCQIAERENSRNGRNTQKWENNWVKGQAVKWDNKIITRMEYGKISFPHFIFIVSYESWELSQGNYFFFPSLIVAVFLFSSYPAVSTGKSSLANDFHSKEVTI